MRLVESALHDFELKLSRNFGESTLLGSFSFVFFLFYLVFFTAQCNKMHTHRMLHFAIVLVKFVTCQQNIVTRIIISGRGSILCLGSCVQAFMQMKMAFEMFIKNSMQRKR